MKEDKVKDKALPQIKAWLVKEDDELLKAIVQSGALYNMVIPVALWYRMVKQKVAQIGLENLAIEIESLCGETSRRFEVMTVSQMLNIGLVRWATDRKDALAIETPNMVARIHIGTPEGLLMMGAPVVGYTNHAEATREKTVNLWQGGQLVYSGILPGVDPAPPLPGWFALTREFNRAVRPLPQRPVWLDDKQRDRQYVMMLEELEEFVGANTLVEQIDALLDLAYVLLGAVCEMGINPDPLFRIIHRANMTKVSGGARQNEDGKVMKPADWQDPTEEMRVEILRQIREGVGDG